jgi:pilus assembly protein CpaB
MFMNRSRLLMIGALALALGGFASLIVYRNLRPGTGVNTDAGTEVVIAANDLPVGSKIEDKDVKLVRFPKADLPANAISKRESVIDRGVILPIAKGEFILPNKIAGQNAGYGLPALIPPGMRAVSVRVNEVVAVAGFVQPGTRVDVLWTGSSGSANEAQTTTVLENVAVLATGQRMERNPAGEAFSAPVITLLVSPDDAQKLALASGQGHIQLALRNPLDTKAQDLAAMRSNVLLKNVSAPAPVSKPHIRRSVTPPPAPPAPYEVEVIRGDKKTVTKFPESQ